MWCPLHPRPPACTSLSAGRPELCLWSCGRGAGDPESAPHQNRWLAPAVPAPQATLFHSIKPLFANKPVVIVANKTDVVKLEELSGEGAGCRLTGFD